MSELNFVKNYENNKEEQEILLNLLRSYAIAKQATNFQLPSVLYLDEIATQIDDTRAEARRVAEEFMRKFFKVSNFQIQTSVSPKLGMYNATCDTGKVINLENIKDIVKRDGFQEKSIRGYEIKATDFVMYNGKFKKLHEYTQEYGNKNLSNQPATNVQFKMKITKDGITQGASLNIYRSGRIRFSSGYFTGSPSEVRLPLQYISRTFYEFPENIAIKINNNTVVMKTNAKINIVLTYVLFSTGIASKFKGYEISSTFEPERNKLIRKGRKDSPFLYITFKGNNKFTLIIANPGTLLIEGASDVQGALQVSIDFLNALRKAGLVQQIRNPKLNLKKEKTKLAKRLNMKPSPEVTRRGTSCPPKRRPDPYSFQGACPPALRGKHYVRPNPQGQPCCYKVPKSIAYSKNKVEARYKKSNVKVPNSVRKTFGFGSNTNQKQNNVSRQNINLNIYFNKSVGRNKQNPVGLKIGSRQCLRFSKVALVDIAKRKGITLPKKVTKPILCDLLAKLARSPSPNRKGKKPMVPSPSPNRKGKKPMVPSPSPNRKTPTPNRAGPSRPRRSPSPNNENFANLLTFARGLRA